MFKKLFDFLILTNPEDGTYQPTLAGNLVLLAVIILLFAVMLVLGRQKKKLKARQITFCAAAITLAVITSIYTVYSLPFGGSITLFRMFFLCFIGYLYGTRVGIITGVAYGLLDFVLKPNAVTFIQPILDFPVAFGCLGLAGLFSNSRFGIIKGYILGVAGRYICHTLSGIIFFSEYAGDKNVILYSLAYNASYIIPEAVLTILVLFIPVVRQGLSEVKKMALAE
jgi:thiamine transporter